MYSRKKTNPYISLVIPVYNESRRIEKGLNYAVKYLSKQKYSWEIIVVNDGSHDNTQELIAKFPVYSLVTGINFGKGHAIRVGIEAATGNFVFFSDIDFSVSLDHLSKFLTALKTNDVVISSRRLKQSQVLKHQSSLRELLGKGFTATSNKILGLHHSDLTCGFKGFTLESAKMLFSRQKINGWAFDSEVIYLAHQAKMQVKEVSVVWKNDPLTKVNILKDMVSSFIGLIRVRLWHG